MVHVSLEARNLGASIAYMMIENVTVMESSGRLSEVIDSRIRDFISNMTLEGLTSHPHIKAYRRLYWRMGVDPTKMRPSPEALARRVLRKSIFPRINNIVDAGNLSSLINLVSIGLYDMDRIKPPLRVDVLNDNGAFNPIGGGQILLNKGIMIVRDMRGIIIHVYAHRDSVESMVTSGSRRILAIAYGAPGISMDALRSSLEYMASLIQSMGDGIVVRGVVYGCGTA